MARPGPQGKDKSPGGLQQRRARLLALCPLAGPDLVDDHLARMDPDYLDRYTDNQVADHLAAVAGLGSARRCRLLARKLGKGLWELTVVAYDCQGAFSIIAGTLAGAGISIEQGQVWTYAEAGENGAPDVPRRSRYDFRFRGRLGRPARRGASDTAEPGLRPKKIVDIFTVRSSSPAPDWKTLEQNLGRLLEMLAGGDKDKARTEVNRSVIDYLLLKEKSFPDRLMPVQVKVENASPERYTVMDIQGEDTPAFLYLFTNALAMQGVDIHSVDIRTIRGKVQDRFCITDLAGAKISGEDRIDELKFIVLLVKQFSHLLVRSPDPSMALSNFEQLVERIYEDRKTSGTKGWKLIDLERQSVMEALARLFGTSNFLWEDFLRLQYENLLPVFQDLDLLEHHKDREEMWAECEMKLLNTRSYEEAARELNRFKDREMFRIDMRHILDKVRDFGEFGRELTDLAEVVIEAAYRIGDSELRARHGQAMCENNTVCKFAVFALGKAGGRELGYASDIELLFVHSANGSTAGDKPLSSGEYFEKLVQMIIRTVEAKRQGIFELDLRFRPYGKQGPLSNTFRQIEEYYSDSGPAWDFERQCLVRLRFIAGDQALGRKVLEQRDRFVYSGRPLDYAELERLRRRQLEEFVRPGAWNAKFSRGGLADLEYHVQHLQIEHGAQDPSVRCTGTLDALNALLRGGYIPQKDYDILVRAHAFLRKMINALRIIRGHARDLLVPDKEGQEFDFLARRMGYPPAQEHRLAQDLADHRSSVCRVVNWKSKIEKSGKFKRKKRIDAGAGS